MTNQSINPCSLLIKELTSSVSSFYFLVTFKEIPIKNRKLVPKKEF